MFKKMSLLLIVFALLTTVLFPASANAAASLEVAPVVLDYTLNPEEEAFRTLTVNNKGDATMRINIEVSDYQVSEAGAPQFGKPQNRAFSASNWISVEPATVDLEPGQSAKVLVHVEVPKSAEPGGHYAAVLCKIGGIADATGQMSVGVVGQIASLSMISVPGDIKKDAVLSEITLPFISSGYPVSIELDYRNQGNIHLGTKGKLVVKNWLGKHVQDIKVPASYVLPNASQSLKLQMANGPMVGFYSLEAICIEPAILSDEAKVFIVFPWTLALGIFFVALSVYSLGKRQGKKSGEHEEEPEMKEQLARERVKN